MSEPTIGDNSVPKFAKDQLKSIIERIEHVEAEIKGLSDDRNDIYKEAGGNGFDVKALRSLIRIRKQDPDKRAEQEANLESYMNALGMLA